MTMIEIIEKPAKPIFSAWLQEMCAYTEVSFKDESGKEHYIFNRFEKCISNTHRNAAEEHIMQMEAKEKHERLTKQLKKNNGTFVNMYGTWPWATKETLLNDPIGFIESVQKRKYHFNPDITDITIHDDGTDFMGNLLECSSSFFYRIYSEKMQDDIIAKAKELNIRINDHSNE